MRDKDVPQDIGISEGLKEVCYAVDENGRYVLVPSAGWEPKNITNYQAWEQIAQELSKIRDRVLAGELSPLAFHMEKNLMNPGLLAKYVDLPRWRVKRHLKPKVFAKLNPSVLERYSQILRISVQELNDPSAMKIETLPGGNVAEHAD